MAHDNEDTWILTQDVVKAIVIKRVFLDRDLLVELLNSLDYRVKHDVRLDDLALRHRDKLVRYLVLLPEGVGIGKDDIRSFLDGDIGVWRHICVT